MTAVRHCALLGHPDPDIGTGVPALGQDEASVSQGHPEPSSVSGPSRTAPRQVNDTPFRSLTREEAVQFLLALPPGEDVELLTQHKQDSESPPATSTRGCPGCWGGPCHAGERREDGGGGRGRDGG